MSEPDAARLYLDEDVHAAVASGLRRRGHDVLTTVEAGRSGATDLEQLSFAASEERAYSPSTVATSPNCTARSSAGVAVTSAS